jgi:putative membrane protein
MRGPVFRFFAYQWFYPGHRGKMTDRDNIVPLLIRWLMLAAAVWVAAELISGIYLEGLVSTLVVAAVLGLLNLYLRPILVLLSLPFTIITLGLFIIVINAILLGLTDWLVDIFGGIEFGVDGILSAVLGAIIISLVNMVLGAVLKPKAI